MQRISAKDIEEAMRAAGTLPLPKDASGQFAAYLELLLRWNARINLTAIRSPEEIIRRHFVECAFAAGYLPQATGTLLDFGSGAGFPGIPIAICRPDIAITLAESQAKKGAFLSEALRVLGIAGEVYPKRVESMPASRTFGGVTMRAVDRMPEAILVASAHVDRILALMLSLADATAYRALAPEFTWNEPVLLPNSAQAVLLIGKKAATSF